MKRLILGTFAFVALVGALLTLELRDRTRQPRAARTDDESSSAPAELSQSPASAAAPALARPIVQEPIEPDSREPQRTPGPVAVPSEPSESAVMAKLRDLGATDPRLTLELARAANQRYNRSSDAPERAWYIVRALLDLERRDEARAEALQMQREYPGSRWSDDIYRHVLVNPGTDPAERGYGKTYELDVASVQR